MKPQHLKIQLHPEHSFGARHDVAPAFYNKLHYHPELELVYIVKGTGKQFIGNTIHFFKSDDMILVGENLPHLWRSDDVPSDDLCEDNCEAYVIHFTKECFGENFFHLPENRKLLALFNKAKRGISIRDGSKQEIIHLMKEALNASTTKKIICLLSILDILSNSKNSNAICKQNSEVNFSLSDTERINVIYQYILQNFYRELPLKEIASIAHLTPNAFCRYFKSRVKKSLSKFLIEVRIGHACKLLAETDKAVAEICYESGYNNFSNFNRHFKLFIEKTPLLYRRDCKKVVEL